MLDHIGFVVSDFDRSKAFYTAALAPLAMGIVKEVTAEPTGGSAHAGFGPPGQPFFWIGNAGAAGGPGFRPHYHTDYYAAFILDPDGDTIEAVCHQPD